MWLAVVFLRPRPRGVPRRRPVRKPPQHVAALPPQLQLQPAAKGAGPAVWCVWAHARLAAACAAARVGAARVGVKGAGPAVRGRARLATACSGGARAAARNAAAGVCVRRGTRSVAARRTAVPPTARAADAVAVR